MPPGVLAAKVDDLPYRIALPASWTIGTPDQQATFWGSFRDANPEMAERQVGMASYAGPIVLIAYDRGVTEARNPTVTCMWLPLGTMTASDALDLGERQNLEGIKQSPGLVGTPTSERVTLPAGTASRIRWRQANGVGDITSIGYQLVTGPLVVTCVFRDVSAVAERQQDLWQSVMATVTAGSSWIVTAVLKVGVKPFELAAGAGAVWVANADSGELSRIDPATNDVTSIDLRRSGTGSPWDVAFAEDRVWVTIVGYAPDGTSKAGALVVLEPATGKVIGEAPVGHEPLGLVVGLGSAWVSNATDGTVTRIDAKTLKVITTIKVGANPQSMAVTEGSVWVAGEGTIYRIDPGSNKVAESHELGQDVQSIVGGDRGIWIAARDAILLLDPSTMKVAERIDIPGVIGLAAAGGTIWAAEGYGLDVHEIDEATATVVSSTVLGTNSWGIAELDGTVWVVQPAAEENKFADRLPGTVTRLDH